MRSLSLMCFFLASIQMVSSAASGGDGFHEWIRTERPSRGIAVVAHGLNSKPEKMRELETVLRDLGLDIVRITFAGHAGHQEAFKRVTAEQWRRDFREAYRAARLEADARRHPLFFLGYSLGSAVGLDLISNEPEIRFDRMILLAPAWAVRPRSHLIQGLRVLGGGFLVPSLGPRSYRANGNGTSVAAYEALFECIRHIKAATLRDLRIPTLAIFDPKDELVSGPRLERLIASEKLESWQLLKISTKGASVRPSYHHLIIDSASMSAGTWHLVQARVREHVLRGLP